MSAPDQVLLAITPTHPLRGYLRSVHPRLMGLILLGAAGIAAVALATDFDEPSQILAPLALVAVIVALSVVLSFLAVRRSRLEVTVDALKLFKGRRPPLMMPREDLGLVREVLEFRHGLGAFGPALLLFDKNGLALLTMSGDSWSESDRAALLAALGSPELETVSEPMNRGQFVKRFPDAVSAATQKAMVNQRYLVYVVLASTAGVTLWAVLSHNS